MKAYFNNIFREALLDEKLNRGKVRVVSGYDPLRDEYIISVYNMGDFTSDEIDYDPLTGVFDDVEIIDPTDVGGGSNPGDDPQDPVEPTDGDPGEPVGGGGGGTDDDTPSEPDTRRLLPPDSEEEYDPKKTYLGLSASEIGFTSKGDA